MAHPMKGEAVNNDPKWLSGLRKYATGGGIDPVAKKGGSPTSSKTATKTSTKTSTVANPKGNVTVTGGAGDGDTQVTIGKRGGKVR